MDERGGEGMRDIGRWMRERGRGNEGYREMDERGGEGMRDIGRWMREEERE